MHQTSFLVYCLSAISSTTICDIITNPFWVVRVRYQTEYIHSKRNLTESFNVFREINRIYTKEGFFALYRGFIASFLSCHHSVIQFYTYETLKKKIARRLNKNDSDIPFYYIMLSSVTSKSNLFINLKSDRKFVYIPNGSCT